MEGVSVVVNERVYSSVLVSLGTVSRKVGERMLFRGEERCGSDCECEVS